MRPYEKIVDTPVVGLLESPVQYARALADAELRLTATMEEQLWLREHPLLWMRALNHIRREVNSHIDRTKQDIQAAKPVPGAANQAEAEARYLQARADGTRRNVTRTSFLLKVRERINEVRWLCGPAADQAIIGDRIADLALIVDKIDAGDVAGARAHALSCAERLTRDHQYRDVPDNSGADPMRIELVGYRPGLRLNCRACGKGKVNVDDAGQRCPACGQQHRFVW